MNELQDILKSRFEKNMVRHEGVEWEKVWEKLAKNAKKLESVLRMEKTGGEPDVVVFDNNKDEYMFCDCSSESPKDRRSLCYDKQALDSRKTFKPKNSAVELAKSMGIELLTEDEYGQLQKLGEFDIKTSSWLKTPTEIRKLGGAIFADRRYNTVFVYHNGAESYYASRGFRGVVRV